MAKRISASKKGRINKSVLDESKETMMEKLHLTHGGYLTNAAMSRKIDKIRDIAGSPIHCPLL